MRRHPAVLAAMPGPAVPAAAAADRPCSPSRGGFEEGTARLDADVRAGARRRAEEGFRRVGLDGGGAALAHAFRHPGAEPCPAARMDRHGFVGRFGNAHGTA